MASQIQIVLQTDVENLGAGGDVVSVRPGFARNYLIPRGSALPATKGNLARIEELKKQAVAASQLALETAKSLKVKVEATSIKLARKVGADSKMYGSVTVKDIEEAYKAAGLEIDRRKIELTDAIKALGLSDVKVKLHPEVEATLRVEVVKA
jgi:large subunit ribosomal protein L9